MKVHWTDTAEGHLDAIYDYLAQDSRQYAKRMVDRLTGRSRQIANHPLSGRRIPEYDFKQIREVIEGSYRSIYHIKSDRIDVIAIIHGAMDILGSPDNDDNRPAKAHAKGRLNRKAKGVSRCSEKRLPG